MKARQFDCLQSSTSPSDTTRQRLLVTNFVGVFGVLLFGLLGAIMALLLEIGRRQYVRYYGRRFTVVDEEVAEIAKVLYYTLFCYEFLKAISQNRRQSSMFDFEPRSRSRSCETDRKYSHAVIEENDEVENDFELITTES